jgi:exosortase
MADKHSSIKQRVKAVILAGSGDFGRCPLASRWPPAVWPVGKTAALERLLRHLAREGIREAVVCCNGDASLLREAAGGVGAMKVRFIEEPLPAGAAGCIRQAADGEKGFILVVLNAAMVLPPGIDELIEAHRLGKAELTVMFETGSAGTCAELRAGEIYVCEDTVLQHIPAEGYCDIKETLISTIVQAGGSVHAAKLRQPAGNFRDRASYLAAIGRYLADGQHLAGEACGGYLREGVWVGEGAVVEPSSRIFPPVLILPASTVQADALVLGPAIIGAGAVIGRDSFVAHSVLWDGSQVGQGCQISNCVLGYQATAKDGQVLQDTAVTLNKRRAGVCGRDEVTFSTAAQLGKPRPVRRVADTEAVSRGTRGAGRAISRAGLLKVIGAGFLVGAFVWSYWPGLIDLWNIWRISDEYSCGLLVPFLAVYVLWSRRRGLGRLRVRCCLWGVPVLLGAQVARLFGLFFMYSSVEWVSIVASIWGVVLFLGGWEVFRKNFTILLFLCLMLPWPRRVQMAVGLPLQHWATSSAAFCLETAGYEVWQEGNIIRIREATVAVAEACNGLRMITAFFMITGLVVLLVRQKWWVKLVLLVSSLPIALVCNTCRLTVTALAYTVLAGQRWEKIFHDFGGYAMMPIALGAIVAELWLVRKLTVEPGPREQLVVSKRRSRADKKAQ